MTLKDAILAVMKECDLEFEARGANNPYGLERKAYNSVLDHEHSEIKAAKLIAEITGGSTIWPPENHAKIAGWIMVAFRWGMRVQRKLDHPDRITSIFDHSYDAGGNLRGNPGGKPQ